MSYNPTPGVANMQNISIDQEFDQAFEEYTNGGARAAAAPPPGAVKAQPDTRPVLTEYQKVFKPSKDTPSNKTAKRLKKFSEVFGYEPTTIQDFYGEVFEPDDFDELIRGFIPAARPHYFMDQDVTEALWLAHALHDSVFLTGESGVGKSSVVQEFAARIGQPFIRFNGRGDLESSALFGQPTVDENGLRWVDGPLTEGVKHGAIVLLDEVSAITAEIMMGLQWLGERDGKLLLSDKPGTAEERQVDPDPRFRLMMADNTKGQGDTTASFSGTNVMNTATLNRIGTVVEMSWLPPNIEAIVLGKMFPDFTATILQRLVAFAGVIRSAKSKGQVSLPFSLRTLEAWLMKMQYVKTDSVQDALLQTLATTYTSLLPDDDEAGAVTNLYDMHVESLWATTMYGEA